MDPDREMSQYIRERWGAADGAPAGPIYAITQTEDGYLWIGAEAGLFQFDGFQFRRITNDSATVANVLGLEVDDAGALWVRLPGPTLLRYRDGSFEDATTTLDMPFSNVTGMSRTREGGLLIARLEDGAVGYRKGAFETLATATPLARSPVISLAQTGDGDIWLGTRDAGLYQVRGDRVVSMEGLPDAKVNCLMPVGERDLWVGTDRGIAHWNGARFVDVPLTPKLRGIRALAMTSDRDSNVWIGTNSAGLLRVNERGVSAFARNGAEAGEAVTALFEDREGNLWIGSSGSIERLRDSPFVTYSASEGLPPGRNGPVFVDRDDRVWFAPRNGGLYWLKGEEHERVQAGGLGSDVIYSLDGAGDELWIGRQQGGLTRLRRGPGGELSAKTFTQADGLAQDSIYAVHLSSDGSVWAGTLSSGVSKLSSGVFTTYSTADGLPSNGITAIAEDAGGTMWFGTPNGLASLSGDRWAVFGADAGLPSESVHALLQDSSGVLWIGTSKGLAFRSEGALRSPTGAQSLLGDAVFGLADDGEGALWIATSKRVLRVEKAKLIGGAVEESDVREYGPSDGLHSDHGVRRYRSVVSDHHGRIWFSLDQGLSVVDPGRLVRNAAPSILHIQTVSNENGPLEMQQPVRIPTGSRRVILRFSGLNLSAPERVRFRYKLDSFDRAWSDPTANREVVYTNLSPGPYRFRVMASNGDGVWNGAEEVVALEVEPAIWQTLWFRLGSVALLLVGAVAFYRVRLHDLTKQLNMRFEERLAERTRIAQELHDTLLQGFLSASMQLHVAADQLPESSPVKPSLSRILQLMSQVTEEGRNAVRGLRTPSTVSVDLGNAFSRIEQELGSPEDVGFRVIVEGHAQPLHPILRDEVYRIGREAILNAFRHARAKHIEVEIHYAPRRFRVVVRDDGSGIDPEVLQSGRDGHWGLPGMRERAEKIGGRLSVWSKAEAGTEVELSVPGNLAFATSATTPAQTLAP